MKAIDTADWTLNHAHDIFNYQFEDGSKIEAVGVYLRPDRTPTAEIAGLKSVGLQIFSIYEWGNPTTDLYFTNAQGQSDANRAIENALRVGMPSEKPIFTCYDFETTDAFRTTRGLDYIQAYHATLKSAGYYAGCYGDWLLLNYYQQLGYSHASFLSESRGFPGWEAGSQLADIVQLSTTTIVGLDVDVSNVLNPNVLW